MSIVYKDTTNNNLDADSDLHCYIYKWCDFMSIVLKSCSEKRLINCSFFTEKRGICIVSDAEIIITIRCLVIIRRYIFVYYNTYLKLFLKLIQYAFYKLCIYKMCIGYMLCYC